VWAIGAWAQSRSAVASSSATEPSSEPGPPAPSIVAVIPAHNEGRRIGAVVGRAADRIPVIVVDDGSTDDTADKARSAGATVIEQRPNQGKGAALRAGFRRALAERAEAIVTLDGDGQHDPTEIARFLAAYADARPRPELVIGRRDFREMPLIRRLANELGRRAFSWAVGRHIPDNQSGYRLIGGDLAQATLASDEAGFEFEVEVITTCIRRRGRIAWVPIRTIYAGGSSHIRPIHHLAHFLRIVLQARRAVRTP
jgi:glycosyltransferase involved in cell wall biosynthesis